MVYMNSSNTFRLPIVLHSVQQLEIAINIVEIFTSEPQTVDVHVYHTTAETWIVYWWFNQYHTLGYKSGHLQYISVSFNEIVDLITGTK